MDSGDVYYSHSLDDFDDVSSNGQGSESSSGGMSYSQNREDDGTFQVEYQNRELVSSIQQEQDTPSMNVHGVESSIDEPNIGLEFKDEEEARRFYNIYAYKTGFSIRKASHYKAKRKDNMVTSHYYVCSKEGHFKSRAQVQVDKGTPQKSMQYGRTGCKAHLRIKMQEDSKWVVTAFEKEHNHNLVTSPSKARFLRSHRSITTEQKQMIHMLSEQNISTSQIMTFMTAREGGSNNIHFTRKDLNNQVSERNRRLRGVDISSTIDYFHKIQAKDPSFFYAIEVDEENTIRNLFWIDGRSRMAYQNFGDVITFDTTYMTNKYYMPFAPFIGVNHHRQSIFFGCALIRDESANTFCWLFQTWLQAIFGQHPKSIITDQDPAMKKAIKQVFPNTIHRCCQWHVMRKARENLGVLYNTKEGFKKELETCINNSITVEEFEVRWSMMLEKFELQDNNHLQIMWNSRESWVPTYFRDAFFAEMSTSQRSESMNALTKIYMDCHTSIFKFVTQFEKMVASRYDKEDEADFRSGDGEQSLWSHNPIEKEAREVYTRRVYSEFKNQLRSSTGFELTEVKENLSYKISIMPGSTLPYQGVHSYTVNVNPSRERVECSCKYFEFSGLLCSHALKVIIHLNMHKIPPHYIMKRWTKVAKRGALGTKLRSIEAGDSLNSKALRFNALSLKVQKIPFEASKYFESYEMACEKIDRLVEEIISLNQAMKEKQGDNIADDIGDKQALSMRSSRFVSDFTQSSKSRFLVKDPPHSQCKGRRKPERFKPPVEKYGKKSRTCANCKKKGHNVRTCKEVPLGEKFSKEDISGSDEERETNYEGL